MRLKLRVKSDGTPSGTTVKTADGKELAHVRHLVYEAEAQEFPRLLIEVQAPIMSFESDHVEVSIVCPCCGRDFGTHKCND